MAGSTANSRSTLELSCSPRRDANARHYSRRTETVYVQWVRRYVLFHGKRHPSKLGAEHVTAFLSALATDRKVAASGHRDVSTTMVYTHVLNRGGRGVMSPLDS